MGSVKRSAKHLLVVQEVESRRTGERRIDIRVFDLKPNGIRLATNQGLMLRGKEAETVGILLAMRGTGKE